MRGVNNISHDIASCGRNEAWYVLSLFLDQSIGDLISDWQKSLEKGAIKQGIAN